MITEEKIEKKMNKLISDWTTESADFFDAKKSWRKFKQIESDTYSSAV